MSMRIKEISVTNLFGIFNHIIPLNLKERITIIHGRNGFGKTTLLKLVNAIFNSRYYELESIPFQEFKILFDDGSILRINHNIYNSNKKDKVGNNEVIIFWKAANKNTEEHFPLRGNKKREDFNFPLSAIDDLIPGLERIDAREWLYLPTDERLSFSEVLEKFGRFLPGIKSELENSPKWLDKLVNSLSVNFIESQRLLNVYDEVKSPRRIINRISLLPSVSTYADELAKKIQNTLAEYGKIAQSLDRSFPVRVMQKQKLNILTDEELRQKLIDVEKKRSRLINIGLLDKDETTKFTVEEKMDESIKKLLSLYIEDVEKKLSVFQDLSERIEIFKRIINERFSYKEININKDKGFTFTSNGKSLSPMNLSSGEQHELVIIYGLLFKVEPNSLILIDEPELSLHIEWQIQFIKDLEEITKIASLDILIATHSPDLINDRWDLTVELKGTNERVYNT
jgi:predicted ATP-binding protein involved in virulence